MFYISFDDVPQIRYNDPTKPANRYVRMINVKENNNLRDLYYRDIMLGEQGEEMYEPTNNSEIAYVFHAAGELSGS